MRMIGRWLDKVVGKERFKCLDRECRVGLRVGLIEEGLGTAYKLCR